MPRCYMVKKALCNKYINSVARGFEDWGARRRSPTPPPLLTLQQPPPQPPEQPPVPPVPPPPPPPPPPQQQQQQQEKTRLPAPKPRYASPVASVHDYSPKQPDLSPTSGLSRTKEHVPVIVAPARSEGVTAKRSSPPTTSSTTTTTATTITTTITTRSNNNNKRSPERPPRSIEQPQAKSAFSRPRQSKATIQHSAYDAETPNPLLISRPSNDPPLFRDRSAAETEAAHDLLELSRSLPPLAPPSVAIGPQSVIEHPASDIQEMTVYQPPPGGEQQLYQVDLATTALYHSQSHLHQPPNGIIYEPTTLLHASHGGVFIPLSPVQEVLFYSGPALPTTMIAQPLQPQLQPLIPPQQPTPAEPIIIQQQQQQQQLPVPQQPQQQQGQQQQQPMVIESSAPLTPPTSECSSDVENSNPNLQPSLRDKEVQTNVTVPESTESAKTASYTFDTLIVADGRTKKCKQPAAPTAVASARVEPTAAAAQEQAEANRDDQPETSKTGKYVCSECGKQYATSSNLSRHKQTHRSIDSHSAKKCIHCGKAYVSMPALAMHVLTHKLTHSCGVCGKMFSRPWLLQGHLRSHTGEKPYGCAHCGKAFADRSNLRAHMQTHSADKNHECSRCHKTFALKSYLNKHLESACQRDNDESSNDADSLA